MTEAEARAVQLLAADSRTRYPVDLARQVILLRGYAGHPDRPAVLRAILTARREWLDYLTRTQRDWQTKVSRRPARGRHHDSHAIRERYVRVTG